MLRKNQDEFDHLLEIFYVLINKIVQNLRKIKNFSFILTLYDTSGHYMVHRSNDFDTYFYMMQKNM